MAAPYPLVVATGILMDQAAFPGIPGLLIQIRSFLLWIVYGLGMDSGILDGLPSGNRRTWNPLRRQKMNLNETRCAVAAGAAFAVLWIVYIPFVLALPGPSMWASGHMIHANLEAMHWTLTFGGFLTGLVAWSFFAAVTAWLIATFYNRLAK